MFLTRLNVMLVDDRANDGRGSWILTTPLVYECADGIQYIIPSGFLTDFASVPRVPIAFLLAGDTAHRPAVLHDWLIKKMPVPRTRADDLFYEAMRSVGMPEWRAGMMYRAVAAQTRNLAEKLKSWSNG